jgi:uncharacterized protein YjbI with pentapeptide repeats
MAAETIKIGYRWSSAILDVEIDCAADLSQGVKLGLAIRIAIKRGANLRGADLNGADLNGADLNCAVLRGADLSGANLRGADLNGAVLRDADLSGAVLRGADLSGANLSGAVLRGADLNGAVLRDADLRDAPAIPDLDGKILAQIESGAGRLKMDVWHTCATTHCRAGWAITLAGEAGADLERAHGSAAAGSLIYAASYPTLRVPNFYTTDDIALADIRERAALATAGEPPAA